MTLSTNKEWRSKILQSDEVPAILKKGEVVFSNEELKKVINLDAKK